MSWFRREQGYDRSRILEEARRAAKRGQHAKAVTAYARICEVEPNNLDLRRRLAVQRARAGQREEAWRDCGIAAEGLAKRGFVDQAIGIYRDFASHIPDVAALWNAVAGLEVERGRPRDAAGALLEGSRHFRSKRRRAEALTLLRRAYKIDPTHFEAGFQLARLVAKEGAPVPARRILEGLMPHARSRRDRRRLRGRLFRLSPTPAAAWRWLVALAGGS